jgi:CubicO group peptidase (beta-lactamase class C family)
VSLLLATLLALQAAPSPSPFPESTVEGIVEKARTRLAVPGLSAVVAVDGEIRFERAYGLADVENAVPATPATVYRLGSVSKPITATAVMQLAEEGKLDLDAPVQKYVPTFPEKPWPITSRELLGHLGGIRHYEPGELEQTRHFPTLLDALTLFEKDPLVAEPGTRYSYSTYGYTLLGCVLEAASGKTFMEYVKERIFEPSGMTSARDDDVFDIIPHRASGYERNVAGGLRNSPLADTSYKIPGGGLCADAPDVARFALALDAGKLVSKVTLKAMFASQKTRAGVKTGYGLGWAFDSFRGRREVFHGGGQSRVSTLVYLHPETSLVVVLLANLEGVRPGLLEAARAIAAAIGR